MSVSEEDKETKTFDYKSMYIELSDNGIIFDIEETDEEVLIKFKAANMDKLEKYIKPKTFCANRSPFSVKNLPRKSNKKYNIPIEDLAPYKEITASISKGNVRIYIDMNEGFMGKLVTKKYSIEDIKADIKNSGLGQRDWFHKDGHWNNYIKYIKQYLKENMNEL